MSNSNGSFSSAVSLGTAEVRTLSPSKPIVTDFNNAASPSHSAPILEEHSLPSPVSPMNETVSPASQDTMQGLRRRTDQVQRRSIIDPASIQLSFLGRITDRPQSADMPLEEGLQKLYDLYEIHTPEPSALPREVQITEVPLEIIANSLQSCIEDQTDTIRECVANIHDLNSTNAKTKQQLISLEHQYCIAQQEANRRSLTTDDTLLRLEWMKDEISRINAEKEKALQDNLNQMREKDRLRKELVDVLDVRLENQKLKEINLIHDMERRRVNKELDEVKQQLADARFALRTVPGPVQRMFSTLGSDREKQKTRANSGRESSLSRVTPGLPAFF